MYQYGLAANACKNALIRLFRFWSSSRTHYTVLGRREEDHNEWKTARTGRLLKGQDDLTVRFTTRDLCGNPVEMGCSCNNGPESSLPCAGRLDMTKAFHGFLLLRCMGAMFWQARLA